VEARLDVLRPVGLRLVVLVVLVEDRDVLLRVDHPLEQQGDELRQEVAEGLLGHLGLANGRPELAGFERDELVLVGRGHEHVLHDVVHVRHELLQLHVEQHHQRLAHALAHLLTRVRGHGEEVLQVRVHVLGERRGHQRHELVDASDRVRANVHVGMAEEGEELRHEERERLRLDILS